MQSVVVPRCPLAKLLGQSGGRHACSFPAASSSGAGSVLLVDTNTDRARVCARLGVRISTSRRAWHSQAAPAASSCSLSAGQDEGPLVEMCLYLALGSHPSGYLHWDR